MPLYASSGVIALETSHRGRRLIKATCSWARFQQRSNLEGAASKPRIATGRRMRWLEGPGRQAGGVAAAVLLLVLLAAQPANAVVIKKRPKIQLEDIVIAYPADTRHMEVARASRSWRKGVMRTFVANNAPPPTDVSSVVLCVCGTRGFLMCVLRCGVSDASGLSPRVMLPPGACATPCSARCHQPGQQRSFVPPFYFYLLSLQVVAEAALHNETWSWYPDDNPRR